jgi:cytochrome c oxidase subunit 2
MAVRRIIGFWMGMALLISLGVAADAAKGKALYMVCTACHGPDGGGVAAMKAPRIAGQEAWYLKDTLKKFKEGLRGYDPADTYGGQMKAMTATLTTDEAMDDVVAYVGSLNPTTVPDKVEGNAEKGKALYITCQACHGDRGQGNVALKSPRLTGQHSWYLLSQLQNFKKGLRGAKPGDMGGMQMRPMAGILADEAAMKDVIAYIQTFE